MWSWKENSKAFKQLHRGNWERDASMGISGAELEPARHEGQLCVYVFFLWLSGQQTKSGLSFYTHFETSVLLSSAPDGHKLAGKVSPEPKLKRTAENS